IGASQVLIYDNQMTTGDNGKFYFMKSGDRFNLATRQWTRGAQTLRPGPGVEKKPWGN
ncbi:MAG: hypothetical protein HOJ74_06805, partial [Gemmatimonadales bacterium]|nr:hypothetical protein [Gemmatimonadales bacterium]